MSAKTLILHVGAPKTGSSALQCFFALNAELMRRQGVHYPLKGANATNPDVSTSGNGYRYAYALWSDPHSRASRELLRRRLERPARRLFLSSEYFWNIGADGWQVVASECKRAGYAIEMFAYVRPQPEWIYSSYCQRLRKHGEVRGLREFFLARRERYDLTLALRHILRFNPNIRLYRSKEVLNDAAETLKIEGPFQFPARETNSGMDELAAAAVLKENRRAAGLHPDGESVALEPELYAEIRAFYRISNRIASRSMAEPLVIGRQKPARVQAKHPPPLAADA